MSAELSELELASLWFLSARAMSAADGSLGTARQGAAGLYAQAILGISEEACQEAKTDENIATLTLLDCLGRLNAVPSEVGEKIMTGVMMIAYANRSMHALEVRWASMLASALELDADDFPALLCQCARDGGHARHPRTSGTRDPGQRRNERRRLVTREQTNFGFLDRCDDRVAHLARQAEHYVHTDPDSCLFKLRLMIETMAKRLITLSAPDLVDSDLSAMLGALERIGTLPRRQADGMHAIRRDGNAAVHGNTTPGPTAMRRLKDAHTLSGWYARNIKRGGKIDAGTFVPPQAPFKPKGKESKLHDEIDELEDRIEEQRRRTREALMLFREDEDPEGVRKRYRIELKALDMVAAAAGEPLIDADFVALVMAMDLEALFEHPSYGTETREARRNAEAELAKVKQDLERTEHEYLADRAELVQEMRLLKRRQLRGEV